MKINKLVPNNGRFAAGLAILSAVAGGVTLAPMPAAFAQGDSALADKPISLNFQAAPIQTVLKTLFTSVGANYSIDPDVQGSVNITMNNVGFQAALRSLLRSTNPPLTYDYTDGVYHVKVRRQEVQPSTSTTIPRLGADGATVVASGGTSTDNKRWYKLPIDKTDVQIMLPFLGDQKGVAVVPAAISTNGNGGSGGGGFGGGSGGFGGGSGGFGGGSGGFGGGSGGFGGGSGGFGGGSGGFGGGSGGFGGGGFGGGGFR